MEKILEETGSVRISHKSCDEFNLTFSTMQILYILSPKDWGYDLQKHIHFKDGMMFLTSYNYSDYMAAWEKFLYYQNDKYSYSWFLLLKLSKSKKISDFPAWF